MEFKLVDVTSDNLAEHPQAICFINPKHPCFHHKVDWLAGEFNKGLKIKLLYLEGEKKAVGFIEYTTGENCWRAISASGYLVIHCLWINGNKHKGQGLGQALVNAVEEEARSENKNGVAVVVSDKSFMADKSLFEKMDYQMVEQSGKEQLLCKKMQGAATDPTINNWQAKLEEIEDLTILYSKQCPWVPRFMDEVQPVLQEFDLHPKVVEITTAEQAQNAPSLYTAFNLIYKGKLLADRYISVTRFKNIVKKELL